MKGRSGGEISRRRRILSAAIDENVARRSAAVMGSVVGAFFGTGAVLVKRLVDSIVRLPRIGLVSL
jgi:hypothetical protein